jgi:hypothetical protein
VYDISWDFVLYPDVRPKQTSTSSPTTAAMLEGGADSNIWLADTQHPKQYAIAAMQTMTCLLMEFALLCQSRDTLVVQEIKALAFVIS